MGKDSAEFLGIGKGDYAVKISVDAIETMQIVSVTPAMPTKKEVTFNKVAPEYGEAITYTSISIKATTPLGMTGINSGMFIAIDAAGNEIDKQPALPSTTDAAGNTILTMNTTGGIITIDETKRLNGFELLFIGKATGASAPYDVKFNLDSEPIKKSSLTQGEISGIVIGTVAGIAVLGAGSS
jgi:hypothetical protein